MKHWSIEAQSGERKRFEFVVRCALCASLFLCSFVLLFLVLGSWFLVLGLGALWAILGS